MKMKQEMEQTQQEIYDTEFKASAGGIVEVVVLGTKELKEVNIDSDFEVSSPEDLDMLQDSIVAACNQAYKDIDKTTEEKMSKYQSLVNGFGF